MRTDSLHPMRLLVAGAALLAILAAGLGELIALQAWRVRDRLAGGRR